MWSSSFTALHNVEKYHIQMNPTSSSSSCSTDQLVSPGEDFTCSGLALGQNYSFTVSAINCQNQEGASSNFRIVLLS